MATTTGKAGQTATRKPRKPAGPKDVFLLYRIGEGENGTEVTEHQLHRKTDASFLKMVSQGWKFLVMTLPVAARGARSE